nr:hypothetical protein CFP56_56564 [Quercus suber]
MPLLLWDISVFLAIKVNRSCQEWYHELVFFLHILIAPYESPDMLRGYPPHPRNRSHDEYSYEYPASNMQQLPPNVSEITLNLGTAVAYPYQVPSQHDPRRQSMSSFHNMQTTYHHRMPNRMPPSKIQRSDVPDSDGEHKSGPLSVVDKPGYPSPAPRPSGPKLKFTPEDDAKLVKLKETKQLTWK